MCMCEQWWLRCTSQWKWKTPLSEHVLCVVIAFKVTQLWGTGDQQLYHDKAPAYASLLVQSFLVKHHISQVTQPHYRPYLTPYGFWLFPKLKWPLKEKRFHTIDKIQENRMGQLMMNGRTLWGPKVPTLKGIELSFSYIQFF